jgi:ribonuclease PH
VVMTGAGGFVEIQGTAEGATFSRSEMDTLVTLAEGGIGELIEAQKKALGRDMSMLLQGLVTAAAPMPGP